MPGKRTTRKRGYQPPQEEEETAPAIQRPRPDPVEASATEPERPYQDFVERETRAYWAETGKERNLVKPTQQEIRAAAMPILCRALRNRRGNRRYLGAAAMMEHAMVRGWIKLPYPNPYRTPSYIDTLIQLADDANWLAREIPLPDHPPPKHPAIYYTIDPETDRPVPRVDSLIRGDYVYDQLSGSRITRADYIYPWRDLKNWSILYTLAERGWDACYQLHFRNSTETVVEVHIIWTCRTGNRRHIFGLTSELLSNLVFSLNRP